MLNYQPCKHIPHDIMSNYAAWNTYALLTAKFGLCAFISIRENASANTTPAQLLVSYELNHAKYCLDRATSNHERDNANEYIDETRALMTEYHLHVKIAYALNET